MEYFLAFKGKDGKTRSVIINSLYMPKSTENVKYDLSFENIYDLWELLNMSINEAVTINAQNFIPYEQFKREILQNVHRIYTSKEGRFFEQVDADIPGALEKLIKQK